MALHAGDRLPLARARHGLATLGRWARTEVDLHRDGDRPADLALFHEFAPPPTGGGHQFLRALVGELERRGLVVERNRLTRGTPAALFNSFNVDFHRLRRFASRGARFVHRVDGPIGLYRGRDDGTDRRIAEANTRFAAATVFQSHWSLDAHRRLGIELRDPVVIPNAVDPSVFHPPASREELEGRRVRVVATSWSDNPRKGADVLAHLDRRLDLDRFELTFVGRSPHRFEHARALAPVPSPELAEILRGHDVYVAASLDDPCSNALGEALACGLPALYRRSGGHPELVGGAGVGFDGPDDALAALDRLAADLERLRALIRVPSLSDVADRYLDVLLARGTG